MSLNLEPGFERDFDTARRAVERGWLAPGDVEAAMLAVDQTPGSRLLNQLPLSPAQLRELETPRPGPVPPEVASFIENPARRVDHYVLVEHLGAGGMGVVHKAWDLKLSRWVALKFLKSAGDEAAKVYFEREARLAAGLSHPNIAAIYEVAWRGEGPFIAMQYVPGQRLEKFPRKNLKRLVTLVGDAARAVAFANRQGVIHRDLKPSNLMVTPEGHLYVMDFGVARPVESAERVTKGASSGGVVGTPEYMPPEQARGESVDSRSDVYSLGATLYELLTGRAPFSGSNVYAVLRRVEEVEPRRLRGLNPRIPPDLETIVLKCLEKDPGRRYATADDLADDLTRFLQGEPIEARPPSVLYRLRRRLAKRKAAVAIALSAAVIASLLGWWVLVGSPEGKYDRQYAAASILWGEARGSAMSGVDSQGTRKRAVAAREAFDLAIRVLEKSEAQMMRGRCLLLERRFDESLAALERAYALDPANGEARIELAKSLLSRYQVSRGFPTEYYTVEDGEGNLEIGIYFGCLPPETPDQRNLRERGERLLAAGGAAAGKAALLNGLVAVGKGEMERAAAALADYTRVESWDAQMLWLEGVCRYFAQDFQGAIAVLDRSLNRVTDPVALRARGLVKLARGLYDEAIADYTRAIEVHPKYALAYYNRGLAKSAKGLHDEAIADLTKAIELDPKRAQVYNGRGIAKRAKGLHDEAIADYTKAIEVDPKFALAYCNRGLAKGAKGLHDEAIADCTKAIEVDPKNSKAYNNRGAAKNAKGLHDEAIADCTKAIELDPKNARAYYNRGVAKRAKSLHDEAIADCTKAIELDPKLAQAYVNRGVAKGAKGLYDELIADCTKAIEVDPKNARAYYNRGVAKRVKGLQDEAIADSTKALELNPKYSDAYYNRGVAKSAKGLHDEAISDCTKAIELDPKNAEAYDSRGNAKSAKGLHDEAIGDHTKAIEVDPKFAKAYYNRGLKKYAKGLHDEAITDFTRAIELDPKFAQAYDSRGTAKADKGLHDEAIADFTKAIEVDPKFAQAYYNRGNSKKAKGLHDETISDCTKAIELDPKNSKAYNNRGNAKNAMGLHDEAIADCTKAIELDPKNARAYINRGNAKRAKGLHDEAIADYTKAIELDPKESRAYNNRGVAKSAKGLHDEAIADYTKAIEVDPKTALAYFNRGISKILKGLHDEAIADCTKAIELCPNPGQRLSFVYNMACAYALKGQKSRALDCLEKAVEMGWKDVAHIEKDPDLESLRKEKRYRELVEKLKEK